jgi:hypothetical protein
MSRLTISLGALALVVVTGWAFWPSSSDPGEPGIRVAAGDAYNPVTAGESLPEGFRQLLPRDAIAPVYDPEFVAAGRAGWPATAQVIGIASGDTAKAYPISFLNRREMVIDQLDGIPLLVSW